MEYVKARQLALRRAYPDAFDGDDEPDFFGGSETKITRPLSAPGSPRERSGLMTPGDFGSLQEGREGLSTEDYVAWKLPDPEEEEEYPFPLTLKLKNKSLSSSGDASPNLNGPVNGLSSILTSSLTN